VLLLASVEAITAALQVQHPAVRPEAQITELNNPAQATQA